MKRRLARQVALRTLYQMDVGRQPLDRALSFAADDFCSDEEALEFARHLAETTWSMRSEIDDRIRPTLKGWDLERLPRIDLNILRLAVCEILKIGTPWGVVINEAVELGKEYSTEDSGRFINGVLGTITKSLTAARKPPK